MSGRSVSASLSLPVSVSLSVSACLCGLESRCVHAWASVKRSGAKNLIGRVQLGQIDPKLHLELKVVKILVNHYYAIFVRTISQWSAVDFLFLEK